jgi:hypothetical protein
MSFPLRRAKSMSSAGAMALVVLSDRFITITTGSKVDMARSNVGDSRWRSTGMERMRGWRRRCSRHA